MSLFQPGDIAACYGTDITSRGISLATASWWQRPRLGPSHVALLIPGRLPLDLLGGHDLDETFRSRDQPCRSILWSESTTLCPRPCLVANETVSGVQFHSPGSRIGDYCDHGGRVDLYRLATIHRFLPEEQARLTALLMSLRGTQYDYPGALLSGTRVWQLTRLFPTASLEQLFCSELIAAVLMRMNRLNHDNPTRYSPARLLRELLRTGKYVRVERFRPRAGARLRLHVPEAA